MLKRPNARSGFSPQPAYEELQGNCYLSCKRVKLSPSKVSVCQCEPCGQTGLGCGAECRNRRTNTECHPSFCPCGHGCQNQRIQRQQGAKTSLQHMGSKQWGLVAAQRIPAGSFVLEYIGEVISAAEAAQRSAVYAARGERHTYFMHLSQLEVIDATSKGNQARFINHSCQPNCETQKWKVNEDTCVCIFALRDISPGEELTYDYHLQRGAGDRVRCQCGAASCRGFLEAEALEVPHASSQSASAFEPSCQTHAQAHLLVPGSGPHLACMSAAAPPAPVQLSQALIQQAAAASCGQHAQASQPATTSAAGSRQHSPDSSATLTGSGRCSDASDLTSSHPSELPKHQHKRIKLGSARPAAPQPAHHACAGCPSDPNLMPEGTVEAKAAQTASQQALQPCGRQPDHAHSSTAANQLHISQPLFQPLLLPPIANQSQNSILHPAGQRKLSQDQVTAAYLPCLVPGLTHGQQLLKDREERQLLERLQQQQNIYIAGYAVDDSGAVRVPAGHYQRAISMKHVFAQRWQNIAAAADPALPGATPVDQLLLDGIALQSKAPSTEPAGSLPQRPLQEYSVQAPSDSEQAGVSRATCKMPVRLSNLKDAMRKAELGSSEATSSVFSGIIDPALRHDRHIAWQVDQLGNTPLLNSAWVEFHVDRFNTDFDISYWSMLELLSAIAQ